MGPRGIEPRTFGLKSVGHPLRSCPLVAFCEAVSGFPARVDPGSCPPVRVRLLPGVCRSVCICGGLNAVGRHRNCSDRRLASVGSRGDSYDNVLAELIIGLYKTEMVRNRGPWRGLDDLELAALEWVDWLNHQRLFHELRPDPTSRIREEPLPTTGVRP